MATTEALHKKREVIEFDFRTPPRSGEDVAKLAKVKKAYGKKVIYDGDIEVTHTLEGVRAATPQEIEHARRTVTLAQHQREAQLRRELAEIEARKVEKR